MIQDIYSNKENSPIIIVKDSIERNGLPLWKAFLKHSSKSADHVLVVLLDHSSVILDHLDLHNSTNIEILHPGKDLLGWFEKSPDISDILQKKLENLGERKAVVMFDSLSTLILLHSASYTCQMIHRLKKTNKNIRTCALLHADLHSDITLAQLDHAATSVIHVQPGNYQDYSLSCETLHKRQTGKVVRMKENVNIDQEYDISETQEVITILETKPGESGPDPTANLTFNLSLSDKEKVDRSNTALPYMHQGNSEGSVTIQGQSKIFYQPDEADDFDEEDPDDDLDI